MEPNKALTTDQLDKLKAIVRQRFDDLYHRIGTSRQKLATTVLLVDQSINKELHKETIDDAREKQILNRLREIEREANNQLPHVHKTVPLQPTANTAAIKPPPPKTPVVSAAPTKAPAAKTPPPVKTPVARAAAVKTPAAKTPPAKAAAAKTPPAKAKKKTKAKAKKKK